MSYLQEMNQNTTPSILGYLGAAVAGLVFNAIFSLVQDGQVTNAIIVTIGYIITIVFFDNRCIGLNYAKSCQINEFWHTLNALVESKVNMLTQLTKV